MTDQYNALIVVLEEDIRDDDATPLIEAIKQLRGVESVTANVADVGAHIAHRRAHQDLSRKIWDVLYPNREKEKTHG